MTDLSLVSRVIFYILVSVIGFYCAILWIVQIRVWQGGSFENPDGSVDDWHREKGYYGIAFADAFLACPMTLVGIVLLFIAPRWGFYLLALMSFLLLWANIMTTATSIRFYEPKRNPVYWFVTFPMGALVGLAFLVWTIVHFEAIYSL